MAVSWGNVIFWTATFIAGLIVVSVAWSYVSNVERGDPVISIVPLLLAGAIWLAGWACRYLLTER
jgi:hypothetical protein